MRATTRAPRRSCRDLTPRAQAARGTEFRSPPRKRGPSAKSQIPAYAGMSDGVILLHGPPPLEHQHVHAFEHDLAALIAQRDGEADNSATVILRFDRYHRELRGHRVADKGRALIARFIAEHGDHGFGQLAADRRRAERA